MLFFLGWLRSGTVVLFTLVFFLLPWILVGIALLVEFLVYDSDLQFSIELVAL